jgi:hypothetical protein
MILSELFQGAKLEVFEQQFHCFVTTGYTIHLEFCARPNLRSCTLLILCKSFVSASDIVDVCWFKYCVTLIGLSVGHVIDAQTSASFALEIL